MIKLNDFKLSKHFNLREFQCLCCERVKLAPEILTVLENLRSALNGKPIIVTSGYRCPEHNRNVGGSADSDHLHGWAVDIVVEGMEPAELKRLVTPYLHEGRLGTYTDKKCLHIGVVRRPGHPDEWGPV